MTQYVYNFHFHGEIDVRSMTETQAKYIHYQMRYFDTMETHMPSKATEDVKMAYQLIKDHFPELLVCA